LGTLPNGPYRRVQNVQDTSRLRQKRIGVPQGEAGQDKQQGVPVSGVSRLPKLYKQQ
jgi:hypothetical protein